MNENSTSAATPATRRGLLKATAGAVSVAAMVLVLFVLPAEYGIDPTGVGQRLGLTAMSPSPRPVEEMTVDEIAAEVLGERPPASPPDAGSPVWQSQIPYRSDELSLVLEPDQGAEIKAMMKAGQRFVFSWVAEGGVVSFDMHGEALDAPKDEFTSYWKDRGASGGSGAFAAPFAGTHGWYWENRGDSTVTVRVTTSGYYEKLFKP